MRLTIDGKERTGINQKSVLAELLPITTVSANVQRISNILGVDDFTGITIFLDHARDAATAFAGAGTEYRIESSEKDTGNDTWRTLYSVVCGIAAASSIVMDAQEEIGATRIETGATLPAKGDIVFFKNATIANSEWAKVTAVNTTAGTEYFDILDGLTYVQPAITLFNMAETFVLTLNIKTIKRIRAVVNNNNGTTNQPIVSRIAAIAAG